MEILRGSVVGPMKNLKWPEVMMWLLSDHALSQRCPVGHIIHLVGV
jgi:hypothetical protein